MRSLEVGGGGAPGWRMRKEVLETQGSPGWRGVHKKTPDKQGWRGDHCLQGACVRCGTLCPTNWEGDTGKEEELAWVHRAVGHRDVSATQRL